MTSEKKADAGSQFGDMPVEEFRRYGQQLIDWAADYMANVEQYPVLSQVSPGDITAKLPPNAPALPESMEQVFADIDRVVMPGITHWNHPSFHAYFSISASAPGILADLLSSTLNVNAMLWKTSPVATELETVTLNWLRQMIGLPEEFEGVIYDTSSVATMHAIAAAREALSLNIREEGMSGRADLPKLRLYTSEHSHSSVDKGSILVGIGQSGIRKIPVDAEFRMRPDALEAAIDDDIANGWLPFCVVATIGTTSTTSVDPVSEIAEICKRNSLWLHIDASYAGTAAIVPEYRHHFAGCEHADSFVVNPHKWLFTPFDLSAFYCRKMDVLKRAFSLVPEYLRTGQDDVARNYMDYGIQLGRRFRSLKLWFILRYFGSEGIANRLREQMRMTRELVQWISDHPDFEMMAPAPFSLACFRFRPRQYTTRLATAGDDEIAQMEQEIDQLNERLMEAVNATGKMFISHTKLNGKFTLRFAIGNIKTTEDHIRQSWELLRSEARKVKSSE